MKKITNFKRIFAAMLCMIMMLSVLPMTANAAKEMFREITSAGVTGIDAPVAGQTGDYTANVVNPGIYTVENIDYYESAGNRLKPRGEAFKYDTEYYVLISLKTKSAYYFSYDGNTGNPKISATCNGAPATAVDLGPDADSTMFGIKYVFPKTEKQNPNVISSITLTGLDLPVHHLAADTSVSCSDYRVSTEVVWKNQDGSAFSGVFEYGRSYTAMIYLFINNNCDFAKDYTHPLATSDRPMPAVTVTLDGETITVMPDYTRNQFMRCLVASKVYKCEGKLVIDSIRLSGVKEPTAGGAVNYNFNCDTSGFERLDSMNDSTYHKGVAWRVDGGIYLETSKGTFDANESYQIVIRLKPKEGFEFDADGNGNTRMTATVNGKNAEVKSSKTEAIVTYTFPKTGSVVLDKVEIGGVDIPEAGKTPDYTASYGANYGAADYSNATTKNGISWYNETDKKTMSTSDKFEAGKTYTVQVMIWTNDGYEFQYKSGAVNVAGTVNGKSADVSSRNNEEVTLYYTFPKTEEHKCSPLKVDEVKATCKDVGKKAYYFCPECGKNFEDSKCTKEISDINAWGMIEKLGHTGGKATCTELARCSRCDTPYGAKAPHNYGSGWDYKDAIGHAHVCKTCDAPDTLQPHTGGVAECGKFSKCVECKMEYGVEGEHNWSENWAYTDSKGHAHECSLCGKHDDIVAHSGGTADCQNKAKCEACSTEYGKTGEHKWSEEYDYITSSGHAHTCTVAGCDEHDKAVKHTAGPEATETTSQNCTVCNYMIAPAKNHEHELTKVAKVAETCTQAGQKQHFICDGCGKLFADNKAKEEITEDDIVIHATGHKESKWKTDGEKHWKECTVKSCKIIIEGTEGVHEIGENNRCTVCNYRSGEVITETEDPTPTETEAAPTPTEVEEPTPTEAVNTPTPAETDETPAPTQAEDTPTPNAPSDEPATDDEPSGSIVWIIVAVAAVIVIGGIAAAVAVMVKKKKK